MARLNIHGEGPAAEPANVDPVSTHITNNIFLPSIADNKNTELAISVLNPDHCLQADNWQSQMGNQKNAIHVDIPLRIPFK